MPCYEHWMCSDHRKTYRKSLATVLNAWIIKRSNPTCCAYKRLDMKWYYTLCDSNLFLVVILIKRKNFVLSFFSTFLCLEKFFHQHWSTMFSIICFFFVKKLLTIRSSKSLGNEKKLCNKYSNRHKKVNT